MHIETLKTFCDLVETGSFHKAAQLGFISQSAVSQQLKALEARYDCVLVERGTRRRLELTEAGKVFYAECKQLLSRFRDLEERLRQPLETLMGTVRIATVYSIGLHELPPYVKQFMQVHPRVKVHVEYSRTDKVCEACLDNTIDFGIVAFPLRRANVAMIPWHQEKLVLVCPPDHPLGRQRTVSINQLRGQPFVTFERDIPTRRTIDKVLKSYSVSVDTVMEFDNIETIKRSVEVGSGIAILPETTIESETKASLIAKVEFAEGPFTRQVGIVHRRKRQLSPAATQFIQLLLDGNAGQ